MKKILAVGLILPLFAAASSFAGTKAGQSEVQVQGALQNVSYADNDSSELTVQLVYNKFIRDEVSVGCTFRPTMQKTDDQTTRQLFLLGRGDYYFAAKSTYVPYAGAHLGFINYDRGEYSKTVFTYGLQGGWKFFVSENISWNLELDYSLYSAETDVGSKDVKVISALAGMSYYF